MSPKNRKKNDVAKLNRYIQALCGIYSRVARRLGLDRSYVSRVAKGERRSEEVEKALTSEFEKIQENEA